MSSYPIDPRIKLWLDIGGMIFEAAATAAKHAQRAVRRHRRGSYATRRPGADTPLWNVCVGLLREELQRRGEKARLARYLGVPRQRLQDFLRGRTRVPDAELTLQMLYWLAQRRAGADPSL